MGPRIGVVLKAQYEDTECSKDVRISTQKVVLIDKEVRFDQDYSRRLSKEEYVLG